MNRFLLSGLLVSLAAPLSAAASEPGIAAMLRANAAAIGAPVPADFQFAPARAASVMGSGYVSGSGYLLCSARRANENGVFAGSVYLSGDIPVRGPGGSSGRARVAGSAFMTGVCRAGGSGVASGSARLQGQVTLYVGSRAVGTARVEGSQFFSRYINNNFAYFTDYVTVTGYLQ